MNYLLGVIYFVFFMCFSYFIGSIISETLRLKKRYISKSIVCGFLYLSTVQFGIAFPAQFFHISWNMYFWLLLCIYILHVVLIYKNRAMFQFHKVDILHHFKEYWLIYVLVIGFTFMSITSQFPYFELNYDDPYYLGSIVQEIGTEALGSVNFFNGMEADMALERIANTFGLNYAFWASLFHIEPVAFARFAAVMQNYYVIFCVYHMLFTEIKSDENYSQFYLIPFIGLMIPAGYLHSQGIISAYDDWQLNTAIWYGSSIVRLGALPVILIFGKLFIEQWNYKIGIWIIVICVSFFSYSSIALPIILLSVLSLALYKYWIWLNQKHQTNAISIMISSMIIIALLLFHVPNMLYENIPSLQDKLNMALGGFQGYVDVYKKSSIILTVLLPLLLIMGVLKSNRYFKWFFLVISFLTLLVFGGEFDNFVILCCMNYNFVGLRLTTSMQMMIFALCSYIVIDLIRTQKTYLLLSCLSLICVCLFNYLHLGDYRNLATYESSGLSQYGYSISRVIDNTHMMPEVLIEIGDIFSEFDKKTRVLAKTYLEYEGAEMKFSESIVFSSNNIITVSDDGTISSIQDPIEKAEREVLIKFVDGVVEQEDILLLLDKYKIDYVIVDQLSLYDRYDFEVYKTIELSDRQTLYILKV